MSSASSSRDEEDAHLLTCIPDEVVFDWLNLPPAHAHGRTRPEVAVVVVFGLIAAVGVREAEREVTSSQVLITSFPDNASAEPSVGELEFLRNDDANNEFILKSPWHVCFKK